MLKIAEYLDRKYTSVDPSKYDVQFLDILTWGRRQRFIGIGMKHDVLMLDYKHMSSFRIRFENLGRIPHKIDVSRLNIPSPYDHDYLDRYFSENRDNPYAVWNLLHSFINNELSKQLTQLPPLCFKKDPELHSQKIERMREEALPADLVFSFNRISGLHHLIRGCDKGMWAHCSMVGQNKKIIEAALSGVVESKFDELDDSSLDVGLYRIDDLEEGERERISAEMNSMIGRTKYNWYAVIRLFLMLELGIPFRRKPYQITPAELIRRYEWRLVCYA